VSNRKGSSLGATALVLILIVVAVYAGYFIGTNLNQPEELDVTHLVDRIGVLEGQISSLQSQVAALQQGNGSAIPPQGMALLYQQVKDSIVTVKGLVGETNIFGQTTYSDVLGSGFVVNLTGTPLVITNFHVVDGMVNGSVAFTSGEAFPFQVLGTDMYSDLAVLSVQAPKASLKPLQLVSSQTLSVGDTVIAIGNPYGLQSSMTSGIVSQLGRAIQTETAGNYLIANVIQISTPINPGNSGGPLIDDMGRVVGVTTAIISGSQNIGFAIPSDAILREIQVLASTGTFTHSYLGMTGFTVDYNVAQVVGLNHTYGVLVQTVVAGGPAAGAGMLGGSGSVSIAGTTVRVGGDQIIQIGSQRIKTMEDLSSYLDANTVPGQVAVFTVIRNGAPLALNVTLGARP
jgi:S1-C subfamily serine protease